MKRRLPLPAPSGHERASDGKSAYSVGYCRPPLPTRFKPGKSGNPKGRPRGRKNLRTVLDNILKEPVKVTTGDRTRVVTKGEAFLLTLVNGALKSELKAAGILLGVLRGNGYFDEQPTTDSPIVPAEQVLAMVQDYVERNPPRKRRRSQRANTGRRR